MSNNTTYRSCVINPKCLYLNGFNINITRLKIPDWSKIRRQLIKINLDTYALFGPFDLLCKYYSTRDYQMKDIFDQYGISEIYSELNHFIVQSIDKYEGYDVEWEKEVNLESNDEILKIIDSLQKDWDSVDDDIKFELIEKNIIFPDPITRTEGESFTDIKAFVFITLPVATNEQLTLYKRVLKLQTFDKWGNKIKGIYWGSSQQAGENCVVEISTTDINELVKFVMDDLRIGIPGRIGTDTHIVINSPSCRQIPITELFKHLPAEFIKDKTLQSFDNIRNKIENLIIEHNPDNKNKLDNILDNSWIKCADFFSRLNPLINSIEKNTKVDDVLNSIRKTRYYAIESVLFDNPEIMCEAATILGPLIERIFRRVLGNRVFSTFNKDLQRIQNTLRLGSVKMSEFPEGMTAGQISEKIELFNKLFPDNQIFKSEILDKWKSFRWLRDKASHGRGLDFERAINAILDGFTALERFFILYVSDEEKYNFYIKE